MTGLEDLIWLKENSKFTILHNPFDQASREFVENNPGCMVVDWYNDEERAEWLKSGGTNEISAFPSVAYERPEYIEPARTITLESEGSSREMLIPEQVIPKGIEIVRFPKSLQEVQRQLAEHLALAAVSWFEEQSQDKAEVSSEVVQRVENFVKAAEIMHFERSVEIRERFNKVGSN